MSYQQVVVIFFFCFTGVFNLDIPTFIHVCHRDDPHMDECLISSVRDLRPYLVKGVPEYNIPSIEPLVMQDLMSEEVAGVKLTVYNVSAYGCSDYVVKKVEYEKETMTYTLFIDIPKLRIEAQFSTDGKVLMLPVKDNGNLEANVTDCVSKTVLQGEVYEKSGETFIRYVNDTLEVDVGGATVRVENLFNRDKVLLGIVNDVINKNLDLFLKQLMPIIEKSLSSVFLEIANDIVGPFTYSQLFPQ